MMNPGINPDDFDRMELYCDVLVLYLLVESTLGECALQRELGAALESGVTEDMAAALRSFREAPEELRTRILEGEVIAEQPSSCDAQHPAPDANIA
jgi:hypothetical protein